MHLVSFRRAGKPGFGILKANAIIEAHQRLGIASLRDALESGRLPLVRELDGLAGDVGLDAVELLPPIPEPSKILCVGLNYRSHVAETGRDLPKFPSVFLRATNTLVASGAALIKPVVSEQLDFEGELAVIIGKRGRHIAMEHALDHVAGFSCFNDGSLRDFQKHSVTAGKNFMATGGFGPAFVTGDEIDDPQNLDLVTRLNGNVVQRSNTSLMIYPIAQVISYVSQFTDLLPGDVIATGTPEGVGARRNPPLWMKGGDVVEVEIAKVGTLSNSIVVES